MAKNAPADLLAQLEHPLELAPKDGARAQLLHWAARYLGTPREGKPVDPVALARVLAKAAP